MSKTDIFGNDYKNLNKLNKAAEFYGVERTNYGIPFEGETGRAASGRPGSHNGLKGAPERRTAEDVGRDIVTKMAEGAMGDHLRYSGGKLPHAQEIEDIIALHKDNKKQFKEIGGNNYNNITDNFKLAQHSFQGWQEDFRNSILDGLPEQPSEQTPGALKPDPVLSERMQDSVDFLNQYKTNLKNGNITQMITGNKPSDVIFDTRAQELGAEEGVQGATGVEDIKQDAPLDNTAQGFMSNYTLKLKQGMKDLGMETRGPGLAKTLSPFA